MSSPPNLREDPLNDIRNGSSPPTPLESQSLLSQYNTRSPAVKRLMREASEMAVNEDPTILHAQPLDDNLFEWHFTFRGPPDTVYSRGIYHGRVILPSQYPMSPPEIVMLTPSGRFETGTKICLSISSYHPETWQPSWSIRTAIMALRSFMATNSPGAIGSLECSDIARSGLALNSPQYECISCGVTGNILQKEETLQSPVSRTSSELLSETLPPTPLEEDSTVLPNPLSSQTQETFRVPHETDLDSSVELNDQVIPEPEEIRHNSLPTPEQVRAVIEGWNADEFENVGVYSRSILPPRPRSQPVRSVVDENDNIQVMVERRQREHRNRQANLTWAIGFVLTLIGGITLRRIWNYWFQ